MAEATYTYTQMGRAVMGNKQIVVGRFAITVYGTEGIPITPARFGLGVIDHVLGTLFDVVCDVAGGPVGILWDSTNQRITLLASTHALCTAGALVVTIYVAVMGT
jgi:hypothetical protein